MLRHKASGHTMYFTKHSFSWRLVSAGTVVFSLATPMSFCLANSGGAALTSQAAQAPTKPSDLVQPALSRINETIAGLNISRWKAPGDVKTNTQQNVDSIHNDLSNTLPSLLAAADAAPQQVSAVFPVYRNIDALYDVLLRVSQTADRSTSRDEAASIADALSKLEAARAALGNAILSASKGNEAEVAKLRSTIQKAAAAQAAAPPKTTIVDDGPAKSTSTRHRKKSSKPATQSQQPQQ